MRVCPLGLGMRGDKAWGVRSVLGTGLPRRREARPRNRRAVCGVKVVVGGVVMEEVLEGGQLRQKA